MSKSKKNFLFVIEVIIFVILLSIVAVCYFSGYFLTECFEEEGKIVEQWIDSYYEGIKMCDECLWIKFKSLSGDVRVYYFARERNKLDIPNEAIVKIKWCYVPAINDWRIRGVWKEIK